MGDRFYRQQGTSRARKYHSGYQRKAGGEAIRIDGIDNVIAALDMFTDKESQNLLRAVNHGLASEIAKEMRKRIPVRTGNLRRSCKAQRRRSPANAPVSDVVFTSGKSAKNDGFYWRFVNHGTAAHKMGRNGGRHPGITKPANFLEETMNIFSKRKDEIVMQQWKKKIESKVKRDLKSKQRRT